MKVLGDAIFWVLEFLYGYLHNYGWAIIALTVLIRMLVWPLTRHQTKSMLAMKTIQPKQQELQKKYKNQPEKLNKEIMALYRKHGVSPLGGCLPMLIQLPILFALFSILRTYPYPVDNAGFLWITDLGQKDPLYVLPILTVITQYISQKQMATDPKQAQMMMAMPFVIGWMATRFPAGLALYWVVQNAVSIFQQWWDSRTLMTKGALAKDEGR
ncbi:MAG TPA: membrane protein insertase YidC [Firmicutes bacterium]|nr:membrane protein insertase YidC [Bacillota bacterium]